MKILYIKRKTKTEKRYSPKMGMLTTDVTYIRKYFLGFPLKTFHTYRKTYFGEIKNVEDCLSCI